MRARGAERKSAPSGLLGVDAGRPARLQGVGQKWLAKFWKMFQIVSTFDCRFFHRLNLASAKIFLKFGNSAFSRLNPIGAFLLETITGKAAEFPMRSPQRIQFFSSNGRPPRQGVKAGFFTFFDRFFFIGLPLFFLPTHPGRFEQ
jgi:hypothetical protein